ncbi:MAG: hypothetical protein A3F31_02175 [Candidatus Levybacteria bacterium RIFCSPHIGHO2_12_FULL_38_12]|nr:MAG: hypothetical protein A2770_03095 [Candidatus Levybacteria bacterium RIFCSPHIGHO2_01_FULL_38_12]OGH22791.1 MAG: hypothetical protein A3F31_02175 [Candidatus Levybacteria bacterium RIFCSPHIGHO2_12_FULL_38_12]OGH33988.1 MAG: hypothetical protein A3A47_00330 [Candidatus Levybacteria bacterium RIFCSPLOWO2_01_FULL_37_20]OGH44800.1 MAG: hypothetical protein A3J14_04630 [Candidatus Levybacteria bacterium RIFCSPLOWO2_02_FULL_37_18]
MEVISLQNVWVVKDGKAILKDITFSILKDKHTALIGQNGSGKTMLTKVITGYQWASKGEVFVLSQKLGEVHVGQLRKTIGWVSSDLQSRFQQNFTAKEVVLSGYYASIGLFESPKKEVVKKAIEVMDFLECGLLANCPFPLLSYGQQKRLLIARSLMCDPKLLILDEPCSSLDIKAKNEFLEFIEKLAQDKNGPTLVFVTHHLEEIVPSITRVICLKNRTLETIGAKDTILTSEIMSRVFGTNVKVKKAGGMFYTRYE